MKKITALLLNVAFIFWIMPLGFFIKPSQEKTVCDGQRAMCMCHFTVPKPSDKPMESGIHFNSSTSNKENTSGAGNYFVSSQALLRLNFPAFSLLNDFQLPINNPVLASIEHVPKI